MLAVFCLRLAAGMIACLLVLPARLINPRFFRTHYLTALGLIALAWMSQSPPPRLALPLHLALGCGVALTFAGSFVWALENAPGARTICVLSVLTLCTALALAEIAPRLPIEDRGSKIEDRRSKIEDREDKNGIDPRSSILDLRSSILVLPGAFSSALVLGLALTAMLMGHSYLIAPSMSLVPLLRLIGLLAGALLLRAMVEGYRFWSWTASHSLDNLGNDTLLWLPVRWAIGLLLPLGLAWMAWQTTRIRSTQSATGILYVVVIFVFLGELTSLLLREKGVTL